MEMKTFTVTLVGKRPAYATDELALHRYEDEHISITQIAKEWGITAGMVSRMVKRARAKRPQPIPANPQ